MRWMVLLYCLWQGVSSLGQWLVSVQSKLAKFDNPQYASWRHGCSGAVLSDRSALTCASCLVYPDEKLGLQAVSPADLRMYIGNGEPDHADEDKKGKIAYVRAIQFHPEFFYFQAPRIPNEFDFGILIAKEIFTIGGSLSVLPLYSTDVDDVRKVLSAVGTVCFTMTWHFYMNGEPVNGEHSSERIPVAVDETAACSNLSKVMSFVSNQNTFSCAKSLKGLPICRVDTGSPVVCQEKLLALIINSQVDCNNDEAHAVMTGINNALAFLTDPDLYRHAQNDEPIDKQLTTIMERATSQSWARLGSGIIVTAQLVLMFDVS